jgi:hypothetical protein
MLCWSSCLCSPRAGALLTQAQLSQGDFAFASQLPESQLLYAGEEQAAAGAAGSHKDPAQQAQQQQEDAPQASCKEPLQPEPAREQAHSLQGSAAPQGSGVTGGGDSVDSRGPAAARRRSRTWLLGSLGALTQAFKRNAKQVGGSSPRAVRHEARQANAGVARAVSADWPATFAHLPSCLLCHRCR